jgi:predicted RNA-binding Zn ribbon-like protein
LVRRSGLSAGPGACRGRPARRPCVARAAIRTVNAAAAADTGYALRTDGAELVAARPADSTVALARLARQAIDTLTGPARLRLRNCGDASCAGIYLDDTGRRRWCSDRRCGSRARVRAHRARQSH